MVLVKDIKQEIENDLSPFISQVGFVFHDGAWYSGNEDLIKVMQIQHFTIDLARFFKTNTATFNLNLGVYYKFITKINEGEFKNGKDEPLFPKAYECHIRRCLLRSFIQNPPNKDLNQIDRRRRDIWYINEDASNLNVIIDEVKKVVASEGMRWFEQFSDLSFAFKHIKSGSEGNAWEGKPFGLGARNSPIRRRYIKNFSSRLGIGNKKGLLDRILLSIRRQKNS